MENRKREIQLHFCVDEAELNAIKNKMAQIGVTNFGAFARRMLIGGLVVNPIIPGLDEVSKQLSGIGNNVNQAVKRINTDEHPSLKDFEIVRREVHEAWLLLKSIASTKH